MPMERLIRFDGVVTGILANGHYRVRFANGHEIIADKTLPASDTPDVGDGITVEISTHDASAGRLFFRRSSPSVKE